MTSSEESPLSTEFDTAKRALGQARDLSADEMLTLKRKIAELQASYQNGGSVESYQKASAIGSFLEIFALTYFPPPRDGKLQAALYGEAVTNFLKDHPLTKERLNGSREVLGGELFSLFSKIASPDKEQGGLQR